MSKTYGQMPTRVYYRRSHKGITVRDNPKEIADHLVKEHGLDKALAVVAEGKTEAIRNGQNYTLSVWREVKVILERRADGDDADKSGQIYAVSPKYAFNLVVSSCVSSSSVMLSTASAVRSVKAETEVNFPNNSQPRNFV
jgi:hypothetical protein